MCSLRDKELTGNQTLYCSDKCSALTRYVDNKRLGPSESIFTDNARWQMWTLLNVMLKLLS